MKLRLLFLLLSIFFFSTFLHAQKWEFGVTMKSNFPLIGIEDEIYEDPVPWINTGTTGGTFTPSANINIERSTQGKIGLEMGVRVKYEVMENFCLISGIEGRFFSFKIKQKIDKSNVDLYEVITGEGTSSSTTVYPTRGLQRLFYFNVPVNIGYTTPSKKWTFFGGLWCSYLLQADFDRFLHVPTNPTQFFEKTVFGVNAGIDFKINSNLYLSMNYSGLATNLFARYKVVYYEIPLTIFDRNTNTIIDNPDPNAGTYSWDYSDEKIPASQNFNLISLGITYQIKN